jgi:thymidylate kinase
MMGMSLGPKPRSSTTNETKIVALEGPSGIGKTTLAPLVAASFAGEGSAISVASNSDTPLLGSTVRDLARSTSHPYSLALALAAARAEIIEFSSSSSVVVCDRFILSSLVYQYWSGIPREYILAVNEPFLPNTIHVLLELEEGALASRRDLDPGGRNDAFKRGINLTHEVLSFDEAAEWLSGNYGQVIRVSAEGTPPEVAARIINSIHNHGIIFHDE